MRFRDYMKYEVFEDGRIWSYSHKKFLKPSTLPNGYQQVKLSDNECKPKMYYLHRVVYEAVTGEPIPEGLDVNHINEIKTDNRFSNLNLMTRKENINWGTGIERCNKSKKGIIPKANPQKQVGAFKKGELVMMFQSTNEAGRNGFDQSAVSACCRKCFNREGNNIYKGYEWRYI